MKQLLTILMFTFFYVSGLCQSTKVDKIKDYYSNIDVDSLVTLFEKYYKNNRDSIFIELKDNNINLDYSYFDFRQGKPILVINTYLTNEINDYRHSDDITKYFALLPNTHHLAILSNKKQDIIAFIYSEITDETNNVIVYKKNKEDNLGQKYYKCLSEKLKKAIGDSPEAILINSSLKLLKKEPFVVIIKGSGMYTYTRKGKKAIELNNYIRKYYKEREIRNLSKFSKVLNDPNSVIFK